MRNGWLSSIRELASGMEALMNRRLLLWLIALVLLATTGCPPHYPPHTPKPFDMEDVTGSSSLSVVPPR